MTNKSSSNFIPAAGRSWLTKFYDLGIKITMPEGKFRNKLIRELNPIDDETILEFGFGTGENLRLAHKVAPNTEFIGLDIDPKIKKIADKKLNGMGIDLKLYDGGIFPFDSGKFDKVFSSLVFHHLDTDTKSHTLRELHRVLKEGGTILIGDWGKPTSRIRRMLFYFVQLLDGFKTTRENVEGLLPEYISDCGFNDVKEIGYINTSIGTFCFYTGKK